jgi:hypothetical protein
MNQQANPGTDDRSNGLVDSNEWEMKHWTDLRRAVLSIVASIHRSVPGATHTLDVQIIPRESSPQV